MSLWVAPSNLFTSLKEEKMLTLKLLVKTTLSQYRLENQQLKDIHNVLLYLKERPEE